MPNIKGNAAQLNAHDASTSTNTSSKITIKGFLAGAFTAAAIGGAAFIGGLKFDDIKDTATRHFDSGTITQPEHNAALESIPEAAPEDIPEEAPDVTPEPHDPQNALLSAIDAKNITDIRQAIADGADAHIVLMNAFRHIAADRNTGIGSTEDSYKYIDRAQLLLNSGVIDLSDTIAQYAFNPYFTDALLVLLSSHAAYNPGTVQAALLKTAAANDIDGFKTLTDSYLLGRFAADITTDDYAALTIAVANGSTAVLSYALDLDAEHNGNMFIYHHGFDSLFAAMRRDDAFMVDRLVQAQAHLFIPSYHLQSLLEQSAGNGHLSLFRAMLNDLGMNVTSYARSDDGTILHSYSPALLRAAANGQTETGRAAIAAGAHPASWRGAPAINAATNGHLDFIRMLRSGARKADFTLQNGEAYLQAIINGHDDIARFMISEQPELLDIRGGAGFNQAYNTGNLALFRTMLEAGGTDYGKALNNIIDDNNLDFAQMIFDYVNAKPDTKLPHNTWNALTYRMSDDMAALLAQYNPDIIPVLDPDAYKPFLTGPEL